MTPSPVTLTVPLCVSKGCFKIYSLFFSFEPVTHPGDHPECELLGPSSVLGQVSLVSFPDYSIPWGWTSLVLVTSLRRGCSGVGERGTWGASNRGPPRLSQATVRSQPIFLCGLSRAPLWPQWPPFPNRCPATYLAGSVLGFVTPHTHGPTGGT